jgi:hypothetical protein
MGGQIFELGARWGAKLQLKPLVAAGKAPGSLKAPLSSLNALSCDDTEQLIQLIREIASKLGLQSRHVDAYLSNIQALAELSKSLAGRTSEREDSTSIKTQTDGPSAFREQRVHPSALELIIACTFSKICQPGLAQFQVTAKLWNHGPQTVKDYHVDIQMPARLLEGDSGTIWHELPEKRTATHRFFRFPSPDARIGPIHHDDQTVVGSLTFYVDTPRSTDVDLQKSHYVATFYAGTERVSVSRSVKELFEQARVTDVLQS